MLSACGDVRPDRFKYDGVRYEILAERNEPRETTVRPGTEMIVYNSTFKEVQDACRADTYTVGGCSILIVADLCVVFILDPSLIPGGTYAHLARHEMHHCNGYDHVIHRTETGLVTDWLPLPIVTVQHLAWGGLNNAAQDTFIERK